MRYLLLLLLAGCTSTAPEYWRSDRIVDTSTRLVYSNPNSHLKLEFLKLEDGVTAFLVLDGHAFTESHISYTIEGQTLEETAHLRKGQMRLKLSSETTARLILALQEGKEIAILASGFQEKIPPDAFKKAYSQFIGGYDSIFNAVKGPIE